MDLSADLPRRDFLRRAVAAGGTAALAACLDREGDPDVPTGADPATYPERQHAWNDVLPRDDHGNVVQPRHRLFLALELPDGGPPTADDRDTVATALDGVERGYERSAEGLLLTVSYSPAYFARFDADLSPSVDLPHPEALSPFEDPSLDEPDALLHLASHTPAVLLAAEEALRGNRSTVNGVEQPGTPLSDVLDVTDRRTGFVGAGLPAEHDDVAGVPEGAVDDAAPLYMGFKSGFAKNQATEDRVTITEGPFAGGTTQHLSSLSLNLEQWYEQDSRWQREAKMFCPHHAENDVVEGVGENLGDGSSVEECRPTAEAAELGVVGHTQKTADARDEEDNPLILRRDVDSTDGGEAGLQFLSLQRTIADFVATREAMNGTDVAADTAVGQRNNNGILQYVRTRRRGNFLLPPRSLRALPPADPSAVGATPGTAVREEVADASP